MSTTIDGTPVRSRPVLPPAPSSRPSRTRLLLACGVAYGLAYVVANDVVAATMYDGYSRMSQAISELSATGALPRAFLAALAPVFAGLLIGFGVGVWKAAHGRRALRVAGGLLVVHGIWTPLWLLAPMSQREVIVAGGETSGDTMHLVLSGLTGLFVLSEIGFGAVALGRAFRLYSLLTAAAVVVFAAVLTGMGAANLEAGEPTPWLGLVERIGVYTWMLWMAVLASALLHRERMWQNRNLLTARVPPSNQAP